MTTIENQYIPQIVFHPGETLKEKMNEMNMGTKEFAIRTCKPEKTIIAVNKGESSITADMAVQFESVTAIPAHFWMKMQREYDEYRARLKRREIISSSIEWVKQFPVASMQKLGWIQDCRTIEDKASSLLSFFGISSPNAWEDYYCRQQLKVAFRISLVGTKEPHAVSAWLRRGDLQALKLQAEKYSERKMKSILPEIKSIMAEQPVDFFSRLQNLCLSAGVKIVYTPCLPKAPVSGSTRWLNDTPLIQISGRYKRNDIFWFTFFHEMGHILLHGKKDIFLEDTDFSGKVIDKEDEADKFAEKWTLSQEDECEILKDIKLHDDDIIRYAKKLNTHPAIIIGRLQYKKIIPYNVGRKFVELLDFN
jgi:Plasmid maintenance system antidote protein